MTLGSCNKESSNLAEYQIQEYIAPSDLNVKNEIIDFLKIAGSIESVVKNDDQLVLEDKDPNEGVWLMEAALNFERYNDFSEDINYKKEYSTNISNKLLPDDVIKMDADDIVLKYNELLNQILQEEIGTRRAKLIDFRIESVTPSYTSVSVIALFGGGEDDILAPNDPNSPPENCIYSIIGEEDLLNNNLQGNWIQSFDFLNNSPYDNGIFSSDFIFSEYEIGGFAWYFNRIAHQELFWNPSIVDNSSTYEFMDGDYYGGQNITPYSNVIFHQDFDNDYMDCSNLVRDSNMWDWNETDWNNQLQRFHHMIYLIESNLSNSEFIEYRPVMTVLQGGRRSHGSGLTVRGIGYLKVNNN